MRRVSGIVRAADGRGRCHGMTRWWTLFVGVVYVTVVVGAVEEAAVALLMRHPLLGQSSKFER